MNLLNEILLLTNPDKKVMKCWHKISADYEFFFLWIIPINKTINKKNYYPNIRHIIKS